MRLTRTRVVLVIAIVVGIFLYALFNIWVFRSVKNGKVPLLKGDSLPKQGVTFTDSRPTGPGEYACSPAGDCNLYGDAMRTQFCTQTYGDNLCLDQCGDKSKLCTK